MKQQTVLVDLTVCRGLLLMMIPAKQPDSPLRFLTWLVCGYTILRYIFVHVYVYIRACIHMQGHMYTYTSRRICIHIWTYTFTYFVLCTLTHLHIHVHICTPAYGHTPIHTYKHADTQTYMHTHINIDLHIDIGIHTERRRDTFVKMHVLSIRIHVTRISCISIHMFRHVYTCL